MLQACQREEEPAAVEVVRPVKLFTVAAPSRGAGRTYPGTVRANEQAVLAFQVAGRLIEYPVDRGMLLKQGELIGSLDPRDYQNNLNTAQASLDSNPDPLEPVLFVVERCL
ncbi:MAG: biotin/lipoyl-binding protein, partial [Planctomycetota bacterium]